MAGVCSVRSGRTPPSGAVASEALGEVVVTGTLVRPTPCRSGG